MINVSGHIFTGEYIYKQIRNKLDEMNQYEVALKELKGRGTEYKPYALLKKQKDKLDDELNEMFDREWR